METGSRERRGDIRLDSFGCAPWQRAQSLSFSNKLQAEISAHSTFETKTLVEHRLHLYLSLFDFLLLCDYFREKKKIPQQFPWVVMWGNSNFVL